MQIGVLRALEFDRVRDALADSAATSLGRARARNLQPAVTGEEVASRLALTSEAVAFVGHGGSLALSAPDDLDETLAALEIEDQPLEPLQLLGLARVLASVATVAASVDRAVASPQAPLVLLSRVLSRAARFDAETAAVHRAIEPGGDVSDRASPALAEIRETLRHQRAKLRSTLESLTRARETAKYLQDQIVTDRNGRYVVVVRAEHREAIPGIVHGSSASGASVYLEPLATVSLNNDVVTLVERERMRSCAF